MTIVRDSVMAAVRRMRPIDDAFFKHVAEDRGAVEEIVRAALGDATLQVESCSPQEQIDVVGRRSVCVDALCRTADGRWVNVEAQVAHRHDDLRRVRMHLSLITATKTPKAAEFKDIPDVAVVYLADYDPLGEGRLAYSYGWADMDTGEPADFGERAVLVNGTVRDGSGLSRLMAVLCERGGLDFGACPRLSGRVEEIRSSKEAQMEIAESMQEIIDRIVAECVAEQSGQASERAHEQGLEQGLEQGREQGREQGLEQGREEGLERGRAELLADLVAAGVLSASEAEEWARKYTGESGDDGR